MPGVAEQQHPQGLQRRPRPRSGRRPTQEVTDAQQHVGGSATREVQRAGLGPGPRSAARARGGARRVPRAGRPPRRARLPPAVVHRAPPGPGRRVELAAHAGRPGGDPDPPDAAGRRRGDDPQPRAAGRGRAGGHAVAAVPGRVDVGLGRSGGSEPTTDLRIRRTVLDYDSFDDDVRETVHHLDRLGADGVEVFVLGGLARHGGLRRAARDSAWPWPGTSRPRAWTGPSRPTGSASGRTGAGPGPSLRRALPADPRRGLGRRGALVVPQRPAALPGPAAHRGSPDAAARRRRAGLVGQRAVPGGGMLEAALVGSADTVRGQLLDVVRRWRRTR